MNYSITVMKNKTLRFLFISILILHVEFVYADDPFENITYVILEKYPHDRLAFTQGLVFDEMGNFFEGTGLYGSSSLRRVDPETGKVLQFRGLSSRVFGEGITVFNGRIYQLTWKAGICYVYNKSNFDLLDTFYYDGEGWGLTHDGTYLIMSNGTNILKFIDASTFETVKFIKVTRERKPVNMLNELEYVQDTIYSNVWMTDYIACISPSDGDVKGILYLEGIKKELDSETNIDVLNGIAFKDGSFYITGKLWPNLFKIHVSCYSDPEIQSVGGDAFLPRNKYFSTTREKIVQKISYYFSNFIDHIFSMSSRC